VQARELLRPVEVLLPRVEPPETDEGAALHELQQVVGVGGCHGIHVVPHLTVATVAPGKP
jgi:hypothetical protein